MALFDANGADKGLVAKVEHCVYVRRKVVYRQYLAAMA